jgi:beta-lactamase regulating signal transducer with metallopeptidase domain
LEKLFLQILNMSITASYVILFVIVVRLLLKKAPKIFSYALWSVVFFRLICPFSFESIFSLIRINTQTVPHTIMNAQVPQIESGVAVIDQIANHSLNQSVSVPALGASANTMQIWVAAAGTIWLLGILILLIYSIFTAVKLHNKLKSAKTICGDVSTELVCGNVFEIRGIKTPFVFGFFSPKIYLPAGLSEKERTYIIKHEQTHIRRFDHIIKPFAFLVLCIHWFNPLAWVAFFLMSEDMELSCDESVIRQLGSEIKKDYSTSLLSLSTGRRIIGGCPLAFGENNTKGRIMNILNYKKPAFWVVVVAVIAVVGIGIGLMTNPQGEQLTEEDYAERFIQEQLAAYKDATWANFENVDSEIITFERLDRFEGILDYPMEIWHIEYRWKPEDIQEEALGNVKVVDGWIVEDDDMGFSALIFSYKNSKPQYLGRLFTNDGLNGNGDTVAGRETLLRSYLEQLGLIPHETYASDHIVVKFPLSTGETSQLFLSQPITQGSSGIWCVERWMDGNGTVYYNIPPTNVRISEYYVDLQKQCDEGENPSLLDPLQVALEFINGEGGLGQRVSADELEVKYSATVEDFLETPESHYIGYISNFTMDQSSMPYFHFDQIEWLSLEDEERLQELNIDPDDLTNGFYIHNPANYPMFHQVSEQTEYFIIDWESAGSQILFHKPSTLEEFTEHLEQLGDSAPPFRLVTKDGYVQSITEQYLP